jgi:hypothetical protein
VVLREIARLERVNGRSRLTTALCTFTLVIKEETVILTYLKDICCGHQFRQICWNYPVRDLFQEQKVHIYHASLKEMRGLS